MKDFLRFVLFIWPWLRIRRVERNTHWGVDFTLDREKTVYSLGKFRNSFLFSIPCEYFSFFSLFFSLHKYVVIFEMIYNLINLFQLSYLLSNRKKISFYVFFYFFWSVFWVKSYLLYGKEYTFIKNKIKILFIHLMATNG